jgi:hypothetical protein
MEKMQLNGSIHSIGQTEQKSEKFAKRDLVLAIVDGNYTQYLNIQFTNSNCEKLDAFRIGQNVTIPINLRGRLWTGADGIEKCFNSIEGWAIVDALEMEKYKAKQTPKAPKMGNIENNFQEEAILNMAEDDEDLLPF